VVRGCPPEWVRGIYSFAALPDVTFFFKAHLEYDTIKLKSDLESVTIPKSMLGAMIGEQSIYAKWFTISWGIGVQYDFDAKDRTFLARRSDGTTVAYGIPKPGPLQNGVDILSQFAIGVSF